MIELNNRLNELIDLRLRMSLKNFIIIARGDEIWILDPQNKEWIIKLSSFGKLVYNLKFFNLTFAVFSMRWKQYQRNLKNWVEKVFEIPIRESHRSNADFGYLVEKLDKNKKVWKINQRYQFSFQVVKKYLEKEKTCKEITLNEYFK